MLAEQIPQSPAPARPRLVRVSLGKRALLGTAVVVILLGLAVGVFFPGPASGAWSPIDTLLGVFYGIALRSASAGSLLPVFVGLGGALAILVVGYGCWRLYLRWAERRYFRHFQKVQTPPPPPPAPVDHPILAPWALGAHLAAALAAVSVVGAGVRSVLVVFGIFVALLVAALLSLLIALRLHYSANVRRRTKYEWLFAAISLLWVAGWVHGLRVTWPGRLLPPSTPEIAALLCQPLAIAFLSWLVWIAVRGFSAAFVEPPWTVRALWGISSYVRVVVTACSLILFAAPLVLFVFLLRYHTAARLTVQPILYLRSFSYTDTPTAFGKIVAPAARQYGVVVALAHESQTPRGLHAKTHPFEQATLSVVADEVWQSWVTAQMQRAAAVVLDRSVETVSVAWELEQAVGLLGEGRVAVLSQASQPPLEIPGLCEIRYTLDWRGRSRARQVLRRWLSAVHYGGVAPEGRAKIAVSS
jgi:hypothetical protein